MKTVFTTGEAAKICKVSQQTIIRCFDNGQLKGFRVPGSRFRRIPRESLYKFITVGMILGHVCAFLLIVRKKIKKFRHELDYVKKRKKHLKSKKIKQQHQNVADLINTINK